MTTTGIAITEDNWIVECPKCGCDKEYEGYFDSSEEYKCKCGAVFTVTEINFEDGRSII